MKVVTKNRQYRAALSQFRCGVLPLKVPSIGELASFPITREYLKVETGRFQDIPKQYIDYVQCVKKMLLKQNPTLCCIVVNITN